MCVEEFRAYQELCDFSTALIDRLVTQHQERRKVLAGRSTKRTRRDSGQTTSESEPDSDSDVVTSSS